MPLIDPVTSKAFNNSRTPPTTQKSVASKVSTNASANASAKQTTTNTGQRRHQNQNQIHKPHLSTLLAEYSLTLDDLIVLSIYPFTALAGQLLQWFGTISPSYFSNKRNLFNVLFVKQGWFWVSLFIGLKGIELYRASATGKASLAQVKGLVLRYSVGTVWWFVFSQWFFGRPLMDRVFVLTGGGCNPSLGFNIASEEAAAVLTTKLASVTSAQCKSMGHRWSGGLDPSGHMFLLAHGSLILWFEILLPALNSRHQTQRLSPLSKATIGLLGIFWWMFFVTNIYYFHSFFERLTGLIWGYVSVVLVYVVARQVAVLQVLLS